MRLLLFTLMAVVSLQADVYKAVYDLSTSEMRYLHNRVQLIQKTAEMVRKNGDTPVFVITIHSGATPILAKMPDMYAKEQDVPVIYGIHETLQKLHDDFDVRVLGCDLATAAYGMEPDELLPFVERTRNSIIDLIKLQNDGYAAVYFVR